MAQEPERVHETWIHSDGRIPKAFVRPIMRFTQIEASSGSLLLIAAVIALIWANAPFGETYKEFWDTHLNLEIGPVHFEESLKHIVNDALMVIFFFVVGLEIKRELVVGELRDPKKAALPAIAALGGMLVPAAIYISFVAGQGGEALNGWAIPMATDIAFSIGVISLLGSRVSTGAKLFLLALAIADDIGAILVIAVAYTEDLALGWLAAGIVGLILIYVAQRVGIRSMLFYGVAGVIVWFFVFESGVHATLSGVALGLMTPVFPWYSEEDYYRRSSWILGRFEMNRAAPNHRERLDYDAMQMAAVARESIAPLDRLEHALTPWSSFVVVPLFALANAGVRFADFEEGIGGAVTSPIALGVALGLLVGKLFGISIATWIAVRLGIGKLPTRTGWSQVIGLAGLAGIGFTVSLFVTELAFTDPGLADSAKIGIFIGSFTAGVIGYTILRRAKDPQQVIAERFEDQEASESVS
ncbi:MAG: Na+/H+ antiporter NhaA [Acidimicrobiia bacterium]|nr:Na+/H+ antiporter NhaA [Acidimicrobiia bacterium]